MSRVIYAGIVLYTCGRVIEHYFGSGSLGVDIGLSILVFVFYLAALSPVAVDAERWRMLRERHERRVRR